MVDIKTWEREDQLDKLYIELTRFIFIKAPRNEFDLKILSFTFDG